MMNPETGSSRDYLNLKARRVEAKAEQFETWRLAREGVGYWPYAKSLMTSPQACTTLQYSDGQRFSGINFATQDYLSLSTHPAVRAAAIEAVQRFGVHSAGSTALAGNVHEALRLEDTIAELLQMEQALLFPTGWAAGFGVIKGLIRDSDHVVLDILAHNCLQEGAAAATRNVYRHRHLDPESAERNLRRIRAKDPDNAIMVVTEGVFSMDADSPDIAAFQRICRQYEATLVVDVAHDLGCSGPNGTGQIGLQDMLGKVDIVMGSFSKTFASNGGFVATRSRALKEYLRYYSPANTFSNALSPIQIAVVQEAFGIVRSNEGQQLRERVFASVAALRDELQQLGIEVFGAASPIVPMLVGSQATARRATQLATERGVLVNLVEFPAVPTGQSRFRLQVMSAHEPEQCRTAARIIAQCVRQAESELGTEDTAPEVAA